MSPWLDDTILEVDGTRFETLGPVDGSFGQAVAMDRRQSTPDLFLLQKPRPTVERYLAMLDELAPKLIVELGIFRGGSTALFTSYVEPDKLVAFELQADRQPALDRWLADRDLGDRVRAVYGIDQAEVPRMMAIVDEEFGDQPLDLVLDDASHALGRSRRSFNALFPRLRRGGVYVLEDWSLSQKLGLFQADKPPMSVLLMELLVAMAADENPKGDQVIDDITVFSDLAVVRRGAAPLSPEPFDVGEPLIQLRDRLDPSPR